MDTQKLRQRILDLAIRGKLVPQDSNDEPASVLLYRIRAEKERLIAEGKIKRPRAKKSTDKSHYQNFTPPFDIPDSWEWVTIAEISSDILYGVSESAKIEGSYKLLRITDIQNSGVNWNSVPYTEYDANKIKQFLLQDGDLLFARTGATVGKSYLVENVPANAIYASYLIRIRTVKDVLPEYLKLFFESDFYWTQITLGSVGIGQPNVNGTSLGQLILPIPPRSEQIRILSATSRILETIYGISASSTYLIDLISIAKSKILDLAMQGKLVPQDPKDEPAADMLRRINPKAMIITDNPQCRNLSPGWVLCQLRDLCSFLSRGKSPKYSEIPNQYPVFAQKCNLKDGDISLSQVRFLDETTISKWPDKYRLRDGDVLVNSTGTGTVGRTRIFKSEYLGNYPFIVPDSHVSVVRSFDDIDSTYVLYCLHCQDGQQYFAENLAGSTNQKELYIDVIGDMNIMLPPINEQKRIVAKIEELYSALDKIEASLLS